MTLRMFSGGMLGLRFLSAPRTCRHSLRLLSSQATSSSGSSIPSTDTYTKHEKTLYIDPLAPPLPRSNDYGYRYGVKAKHLEVWP